MRHFGLVLTFLVLFGYFSITSTQSLPEATNVRRMTLEPAFGFEMIWYCKDGELFMTLTGRTRSYLSLGIARTMDSIEDADIWVGQVTTTNVTQILDTFSHPSSYEDRLSPDKVGSTDTFLMPGSGYNFSTGIMTINFRRRLVTLDPRDIDIHDGQQQNLVWAIGNGATLGSHTYAGRANVVLYRTPAVFAMQITHGFIMTVAWAGLETIGRMLDIFEGWFAWKSIGFILHTVSYVMVIGLSVVAIIIGIVMSSSHFVGYHSLIGWGLILFYCISFGFRAMTYYHKKNHVHAHEILGGVYYIHYWLSSAVYFASLVQIMIGFYVMALGWYYYLIMALWYGVIFALYMIYVFFQPKNVSFQVKDGSKDYHEVIIQGKFFKTLLQEIAITFNQPLENIDKLIVVGPNIDLMTTKSIGMLASNSKLQVSFVDHHHGPQGTELHEDVKTK